MDKEEESLEREGKHYYIPYMEAHFSNLQMRANLCRQCLCMTTWIGFGYAVYIVCLYWAGPIYGTSTTINPLSLSFLFLGGRVVSIGITPWGIVEKRSELVGKKMDIPFHSVAQPR